jgi:hypothetical protein
LSNSKIWYAAWPPLGKEIEWSVVWNIFSRESRISWWNNVSWNFSLWHFHLINTLTTMILKSIDNQIWNHVKFTFNIVVYYMLQSLAWRGRESIFEPGWLAGISCKFRTHLFSQIKVLLVRNLGSYLLSFLSYETHSRASFKKYSSPI